jgi:hypothetical protein
MNIQDQDNKVVLPAEYIRVLYEAYQVLAEACLSVSDAVRSDRENYPVFIPTFGMDEKDKESNKAREAAIKSMTQLFVLNDGDYVPDSGIVCASPATVAAVEKLNTAKIAFKGAVIAIRNFQKETDASVSRISKLIRDEVTEKGYRTKALKKAMGTAGIESLDLKRCYAQIRIMPPELDVFSWTWATNHTRIKKVTLQEAIEMAKKLPGKETSETAVDLLNKCNPGEILVKKSTLPNQLRANYAYLKDGRIVRKSSPISGIVIAQQKNLPRKFWRDNPGDQRRRPAQESGIENAPLIIALNLYRYTRKPEPTTTAKTQSNKLI